MNLGDYSVCVNAATMALIDAGIPMKDYVCACSASYIEDTPILGKLNCRYVYNLYIIVALAMSRTLRAQHSIFSYVWLSWKFSWHH